MAWRWMVLALLALIIIDIRLYRMTNEVRDSTLKSAGETLRVGVDVIAQRMDQLMVTYDRLLSGIGEGVRLKGEISATSDLALHRLLVRRHSISPELHLLFLVRGDGTMAEMSTRFPAPALDLSDRDYFIAQAGSGADDNKLFIGPIIVGKVTQANIVPLSRRVENDGGRFMGVVVAAIDPERLVTLLTEQGLPPGYRVSVFLGEGHPLVCLPRHADCLTKPAADSPLFRTLLPGAPSGLFASRQLLDEAPGPAAYAKSQQYGLVVAATADERSLLESWRRDRSGYVVMAVAGNLVFVGLALFAIRQVQRRRQALQQLADANLELEDRVERRTEQLRRSDDRARTFMNTARDAVVVIDSNSCIVEFNHAAATLFGYSADEVIGRRMDMLMPPAFRPLHRNYVQTANGIEGTRAMNWGREVVARHKDGHEFPIDVTVGTSGEGAQSTHVGIIRDITERKHHERELQRQASTDGLTGVLNRRAFTVESDRLISIAVRHARPLGLMVIDADHFKKINDVHGHLAGDAVLKALARTLDQALRTSDLLGRLGGEEFGILLPETDVAGVTDVGERLLHAVRDLAIAHEGVTLRITVSIGATVLADAEESFETAFRRADQALYEAKHGGRDRYVIKLNEGAAASGAA